MEDSSHLETPTQCVIMGDSLQISKYQGTPYQLEELLYEAAPSVLPWKIPHR